MTGMRSRWGVSSRGQGFQPYLDRVLDLYLQIWPYLQHSRNDCKWGTWDTAEKRGDPDEQLLLLIPLAAGLKERFLLLRFDKDAQSISLVLNMGDHPASDCPKSLKEEVLFSEWDLLQGWMTWAATINRRFPVVLECRQRVTINGSYTDAHVRRYWDLAPIIIPRGRYLTWDPATQHLQFLQPDDPGKMLPLGSSIRYASKEEFREALQKDSFALVPTREELLRASQKDSFTPQ